MPAMNMVQGFKPPTAKQVKNEQALEVYATYIFGLIIFTITARFLDEFCYRTSRSRPSRGLRKTGQQAYLLAFRKLGKRSDWKWIGRPKYGLSLIFFVYLIGNISLSAMILATYRLNHWASRFGWMGAANMAVCVFFGLKNTPLAPAAGLSHVELSIIHRIVGFATVLFVLLHAILYTIHFGLKGHWSTLIEEGNIEGLGAGFAMLILLMAILRHQHYELFYLSHIAGFISVVILTTLHRPDVTKKLPVVMVFIAFMWILDRSVRTTRMSYNLINNHATFYPLADGATRLHLRKPSAEVAPPGSHCYVWIPRLHPFQIHPFTIVSNGASGLEFIIKPQKGFTRAVSDFAIQHPRCTTWVSVDGPYESLPDTQVYDKMVIVSGGSGAAFAFGLMNRVLGQCRTENSQSIDFIWAFKRTAHLSWYRNHLHTIMRSRPATKLTLYITAEEPNSRTNKLARAGLRPKDYKTSLLSQQTSFHYLTVSGLDGITRVEGQDHLDGIERDVNVRFMKMDTRAVIREAIENSRSTHRFLIVACGPRSLLDQVKDSADMYRNHPHPRVDIHCEDFGSR